MTRNLHFSIDSAFIQNLAMEKLTYDNDPATAWKLISDSMTPADPNTDPKDVFYTNFLILDGQLQLSGVYPEEKIRLTPTGKSGLIKKQLRKMTERLAELEEQHEHHMKILDKIMEFVPENYLKAINTAMGEKIFPVNEASELVERLHTFMESDFGWLSPDGTWYPVDYADHENWAREYLLKKNVLTRSELDELYSSADYLVDKLNFCLVHSPSMSDPKVECKRLTSKQKEFLYDYFLKLGMHDRANRIYTEE
ncbi:MAG: hypothetical protein HDQ88_11815 [Clostridia bacterium]|nr:hypothetical protein [Clostridia bacterium]